jgi:hypothetical protein
MSVREKENLSLFSSEAISLRSSLCQIVNTSKMHLEETSC